MGIIFASCSKQLSLTLKGSTKGTLDTNQNIISGKVVPWKNITVSKNKKTSWIQQAYATSSAVYSISLFALDESGQKQGEALITTQSTNGGNFELYLTGQNLSSKKYPAYVIEATDSSSVYKRPITEFNSSQDISYSSTLLSYALAHKAETQSLENIDNTLLETFLKETEDVTSFAEGFTKISTDSNLKTTLQDITKKEDIVDSLLTQKPEVFSTTFSASIEESFPKTFSMKFFHPNPSYSPQIEWSVDDVVVSTGSTSFVYTPSKNSQGEKKIKVRVGTEGKWESYEKVVTITNTELPVAPTFSVASNPTYTSSSSVNLEIQTGTNKENCETFSSLALKLNDSSVPSSEEFTLSCSTEGTQTVSTTLQTTTATQVFYLWAKDASGTISSVSKTASVIYDAVGPVISFSPLASLIRGGTAVTLSFSATDSSGVASYEILYSTDSGATYTGLTSLNGNQTSYTWNTPSSTLSTGRMKIRAVDQAGNSTESESNIFALDSTAPVSPTVSLTSSSITNSTSVTMTVSDCTDLSQIYVTTSNTAPTGAEPLFWQNCTTANSGTTYTIVDSTNEVKNLYLYSKDEAGNVSSTYDTIQVTYDTTNPVVSLTAPLNTLIAKENDSISISWGAITETNLAANATFLDYSLDNGTTWTSLVSNISNTSPYSWTAPQGNSDQVKVRIRVVDQAGNTGTSTSDAFVLDSTAPTIISITLNGGTALTSSGTTTISLQGSDNVSTIKEVCFKSNTSLPQADPSAADGCWEDITTNVTGLGLSYSNSVTITNYSFSLGADNSYYIFAWFKDRAGNISALTNAGNGTNLVDRGSLTKDSVPPAAPSVSLTSSSITNSTSVTMTVADCTDLAQIYVTTSGTAPTGAEPLFWQNCSTTNGATTYTLTNTTNEVKNLYVYSKDSAGNVSTTYDTIQVTFDNTNPVVALTAPLSTLIAKESDSISIGWGAITETNLAANSTNLDYSLDNGTTWTSIVSNNSNTSPYSWTAPQANSNQVKVRIRVVDQAGNTGTSTSDAFILDSTAPAVTSISLNGGAATITNSNISIALQGTDNLSTIKEVCFKWGLSLPQSNPASDDSCWKDISANITGLGIAYSNTISISGYNFSLGLVDSSYYVFAWFKDRAGNMSSLSNTGSGTESADRGTTTLTLGSPPVIENFYAIATDRATVATITESDQNILLGNTVYIKWKITDTSGIPANGITLSYTSNDSTWTTIGTFSDQSNGGCDISQSDFTGCYTWTNGSPTSSYFRIKMEVTNSNSLEASALSNTTNTSDKFIHLFGNPSDGLNGSAKSAVLFRRGDINTNVEHHLFTVASDGTTYLVDIRGLLKVSPTTGKLEKLMDINAAANVDNGIGGNYQAAQLKFPLAIVVDYEDNLLIYDYNYIKKINFSTGKIYHLAGGGTDDSTSPGDPKNIYTCNGNPTPSYGIDRMLIPLPNGDFMFAPTMYSCDTNKTYRIYRYSPARDGSGNVDDESIGSVLAYTPSGLGDSADANIPMSTCFGYAKTHHRYIGIRFSLQNSSLQTILSHFFDCGVSSNYSRNELSPSSFEVLRTNPPLHSNYILRSGMDGQIYSHLYGGNLYKYNSLTDSWDLKLGGGASLCQDDSTATNCFTYIRDVFVDKNSTIYFWDNTGIRTIDSSGKIKTLVGEGVDSGDGKLAKDARTSKIRGIKIWDNAGSTRLVFNTMDGHNLREFALEGGTVSKIAGISFQGFPVIGATPTSSPVSAFGWGSPAQFEVNPTNGTIYYPLVSQTLYATRNGLELNPWALLATYTGPGTNGYIANLLYYDSATQKMLRSEGGGYSGGFIDGSFEIYHNPGTGYEHYQIVGSLGLSNAVGYPVEGDPVTTSVASGYHDCYRGLGFDGSYWYTTVAGINISLSNKKIYKIPDNAGIGTTYGVVLTTTYNILGASYNPATKILYYCTTSGLLQKVDHNVGVVETNIPIPIPGMTCIGNNLIYDSARDRLIFPYYYNKLYGIGEIKDASAY